jgi:thiamine biosynthesis lipoprotein
VQYSKQITADNNQLVYAWFSAMFTRVDIVMYDCATRNDLIEIVEKIETKINQYESIGNRFDASSELSIVNQRAYHSEVPISDELFKLLTECLDYNQKSLGYFNITVNSENGLRNGSEAIELNKQQQTIRLLHPEVRLDLSGFIKGYALRSVIELLNAEQVANALVNIGNSSVYAKGNHPYGTGWKITIPGTDSECVLHDDCLTTSGNSLDSRWPITNPKTGDWSASKLPVSVITTDAAIGEVVATACYLADGADLSLILKQFDAEIIDTTK